jgi:hypothetical protein
MKLRIPITVGYLVIYGPLLAFYFFVSVCNAKWPFFGVLCLFTFITVSLTRKIFRQEKISRRVTTVAACVFGTAYGINSFQRIVFMIHEGGMERRDGYGSPMAFLLGMIAEFFILGLPAIAFTLLALFYTNRQFKESGATTDQSGQP